VTNWRDEERWVNGLNAGSLPGAGRDAERLASIARAEALFASLTEEAEHKRQQTRSRADSSHAPAAAGAADLAPPKARPLTDREVRDLFLAARAASDRTVKVVKTVRSKADTTSADLAAIGEAIEEALVATNERLASFERALSVVVEPDPEVAEWVAEAMDQLARTLRRATRNGSGGGSTPER